MVVRTRIKICGITRASDLQYADRLGVDAIGLVFQKQSPRYLAVDQAQAVIAGKPPFLTVVALFADPTEEEVRTVISAIDIDCLQFHGAESAKFCASFETAYLKAVPMGSLTDPSDYICEYADTAKGVVLDSHQTGACGGSGKTFDWNKIKGDYSLPIILAGGLTVENVGDSISQVMPYGVDVSGGVEQSKGIKDTEKIKQFVAAVEQTDRRLEEGGA